MNKPTSRRFFLKNATFAGMGIVAAGSLLDACTAPRKATASAVAPMATGFAQQPLPYAYNALEPWIDAQTMDIHYNKHAAAYAKNLGDAALAEGADPKRPLEEVLAKISKYSAKMRNNGGGHYNHELFWKCMAPPMQSNTGQPKGNLLAAIEKSFNTFDAFKNQFSDAGKTRFGSGWAWLVVNKDRNLQICSTPNQDNPLMDIADVKGFPLLGLDVWEHAYYLKYQNKRADYIENFWKVVNWEYVQQRFAQQGG
jgi:superoxide dismutase, Fe-Mn family